MMHLIAAFTVIFSVVFIPARGVYQSTNSSQSYSQSKFFVKTNEDLKISEATGKISLRTGLISLDEKINKYEITEIRSLFRLNNGSSELFEKYEMSRIYIFCVEANSGSDLKEIAGVFDSDQNVEFSEPVFTGSSAGVRELSLKNSFEMNESKISPNDEMFYRQWYLQNSGSINPSSGGNLPKPGADIKMIEAWDIEEGDEEVIVAILDSGIKDDHPEFKGRIWINDGEIPGNGIDDDNNGYIDDVRGWDFAYEDRVPNDGFGHGTNIATVIGANTDNKIGFAGIDKNCKLMNCKNLNADNSGEYSWWSESIKYAVDNGAQIINMSEGGDDYSKVLKTAIDYAIESGVLVVAAMMNKGDDRDYYPASFKGVFAVGATDTDDSRCRKFSWGGGSCWGRHIAVVAPGNKIYGLDYENDNNYEVFWSGTSQSTAIVSGIAALLLAQNMSRTSEDLKMILRNSSKDLVGDLREDKPGWDKYYGFGRVDCYSALTYEYKDLIKNKNSVIYEDKKTTVNQDEKIRDNEEEKIRDYEDESTENDDVTEDENARPSKAKPRSEPSKDL